jgi:hypothetical protein
MFALVPDTFPMVLDHGGDMIGDGRPRRRGTDSESLESRIDQLTTDMRLLKESLSDVGRLKFSWQQLALVVSASLFIVGANWTANAPLRATVAAIQNQQELQKSNIDGKAALTEERLLNMRGKVDDLTKASTLQQMKLDDLTNKVLDAMRRLR